MRQHFAIIKPMRRSNPGDRLPTRDELYDRPQRWASLPDTPLIDDPRQPADKPSATSDPDV